MCQRSEWCWVMEVCPVADRMGSKRERYVGESWQPTCEGLYSSRECRGAEDLRNDYGTLCAA